MGEQLNPIRIVIADEQPLIRQSLRRLLESERDLNVLGEASDAPTAVKLTRELKPDILLLDLGLPQPSGLQTLNSLATHLSPARIVVMVTAVEKAYLVEAFRLGAHGIVLKTSAPRILLEGIRSVMAGYYWVENESVAILVEALREFLSQGNGQIPPRDYGLTRRELDIVAKIASGSSNKEVGEEFSISERTVKHHLTNIFTKLGISSRLQLALFAVNHHLMSNQQAPTLGLQPLQSEREL